jgi:hypothetical protein
MLAGHQQEIQAERDRKLEAAEATAEEAPPAGRFTDETDYFLFADHPDTERHKRVSWDSSEKTALSVSEVNR